jgi:N-acetylmuramoyl-L-alanine amidase
MGVVPAVFQSRLGAAAMAFVLAVWLTGPVSAVPPDPSAGTPTMNAARIVGDDKRTRFVADLSGVVEARVFALADPYRIVVDLPEVTFDLPDSAGSGRGLLTAFRYGQLSPGKSRIVLDLAAPVKVDKSFVVPADGQQPARLVIDVVPTTRAAFLEANQAYRDALRVEEAAKRSREFIARDPPQPGRLAIVIDPGHGGIDMGARGRRGTIEKDVTLAFAKVLGAKLEATGLYDIFYTRTDDSFVGLDDRMAVARTHNARLFLSIHANIFRGASVRGAIVYTVSEDASDKMAEEIAQTENQSDALAGIDIAPGDKDGVKDILLDLTRRETRNFGTVFARNLVTELKASTKMFKIPHQEAGFKVLEAPDVPSALVELGFMSNADDERLLISDEWRDKAADSIVRAVASYFKTQLAQKGTD